MYELQVGEEEQSTIEETKENKMREYKCVFLVPPVAGGGGDMSGMLGSENKAENWVNSHPPFCLRFLKLEDLHSVSRGKRGRREGNRQTSVGQSKGTLPSSPWLPCGVTEAKEVSLASNWTGLWRSAKERTTVLKDCLSKWSDRGQKGQGGVRDQPMQEPGQGQSFATGHCWPLSQGTIGIIFACNNKKSAADLRKTNLNGESELSHSSPQPSSLELGTEMKLLKWRKLNFLHSQPYYSKFTLWASHEIGCSK